MWSIQSWQQPQLGSFQTSTAVALLAIAGRAVQAAAAAMAVSHWRRLVSCMVRSPDKRGVKA
ncbi:crossover junction endodeoxyribonuclease [Alicycliphilus sp. B1]|nr:crossover junction endodeoxyribonuclease [Alicycliphilus sp. B1]